MRGLLTPGMSSEVGVPMKVCGTPRSNKNSSEGFQLRVRGPRSLQGSNESLITSSPGWGQEIIRREVFQGGGNENRLSLKIAERRKSIIYEDKVKDDGLLSKINPVTPEGNT
ncbi:hypothetical protein TNCV_1374171 [Trichonephila clavipes]|nr:hypothetical protein TNCV_1374171 [Trichonephila clavipes]